MPVSEIVHVRPILRPIVADLLIIKHALYDGEIRLAQDTVDELIQKLKAI